MLTPEQKTSHLQFSKENLDVLRANSENFSRIIIGDETCVHHHDPETKQESMQWKPKESPSPKNFRVQQSAGKIMATFFWDSKGVQLLEFMPYRTTITGNTCASTMVALRENIKQKRRGKLSADVLLLHDNAPAHKSRTSRDPIRKCGFVELNHPPYSPDLDPSDCYFRNISA